MADVFVYAPDCADFDNIGEAGSLTPISCVPTEIGNGMWDLELVHPIDEMGKWSYLQNGYILVAEAPVRTLPEIGEDGVLVTSVENWTIKLGATSNARRVWNKASGGKVISTTKNKPKPGTKVTVVAKGTDRYKIKFGRGSGWIAITALENKVSVTIPNTAAGIEQEAPAWTIRPQRFRIYKVEKTDSEVTVLAKHIFYGQASNITTYKADNPTCVQALAGLIAGRLSKPADFATNPDIIGRTNIVGTRVGVDWTRARFTEALLDPDAGLVNRWGAKLIRDDEEFCVLADAGIDRGATIEYGKNLIGVQLDLDYSNIVTRYVPLGQTSKGKVLELAPGTYNTDHGTIVIPAGAKWVDASNIGDYPIPLMEVLDLGSEAKAAGTSAAQIKDAREKMIDACLYKWEREQTNYPSVTLNVDFAQLGDTAEYAQYRQLENIFLFDKVRIRHPGIDVDILAEVTEIAWDSLNDRADHITLGKVNPASIKNKLPSWQLPAAIPGTYLAPGTLSLGAVNEMFETDLNMTDNPSVQAVAQQYVRNAWITGEQVFKYAAGSSDPNPASIIVSANLQNVLMDRWQYKNSSGVWTDYPTGDGNATNTATALVVKPGHAVWVDGVCTLQLLTDNATISDTYNLYKVADGSNGTNGANGADGLHGMTAILTNAAHALPKTTAGVVTYTGSGTVLRMFEGATELAYDGVGTSNGTWKVTPSASGITCGSLSDGGNYLTVGDHSGMSGDTASVTFNITGKRQSGADFSLAVTQTLSIAQQGATGSQGIPGPAGADGSPTYTWIKYADTPTSGMSDDPTGKVYMGIAYNKLNQTESSTYSDYAWSLIQGAQGIQGPAGADGAPTYTWIKYATSASGANLSDDPAGKTYIGLAYNKSTPTESTTASDYTWALIQGPQGPTGPAGADAAVICPTLPANPTTGQLICYTGIEPNELLRWTGKGINPTQRTYPVGKLDSYQVIDDLSDQHAIKITIRNETYQYGSGTPSPDNVRPLGATGNGPLSIFVMGENLANPSIAGVTKNGVTLTYDAVNQTLTFNGTCTVDNTLFYFDETPGYPGSLKFAHTLSMECLSGSISPVHNNLFQLTGSSGQMGPNLPLSGKAVSTYGSARAYNSFNIRVDAGTVFTSYKIRFKLEIGTTATDWVRYVGTRYLVTLHPGTQLFGLPGIQDWRNTDGMEAHYTTLLTLTGNEAFNDGSDLGSVVRVGLPGIIAGTPGDTPSICSHFQHLYSFASDTVHYYVTGDALILYIPKSLLSSYDLAGAKAWIKAQATAGTPVQVVYQLATPVFYTYDPQQITGVDGRNVIFGEGAYIGVEYTGSGWAAVGAVQRVAVESVSITPEQGLRVDTVLTSADGSQQVPTYFNARGTKYGLFRLSDGKLLNGAKVLSNGSVAGVVGALIDPDGDGKSYFLVVTSDNNTELVQVQNSYAGVTTEENPTPVDFIYAIDIGSSNTGTYFSGSWHDEFMSWCHGKGTFQVRAVDGALYLVGDTGGVCLGYIGSDYTPLTTNTYLMGDASHGIKKYYGASTSIQSTSDERAKHDMRPLDADQMQRFLLALNPIWYRLNDVPVDLMAGFGAFGFRDAMRSAGIPDDFAGFNGKDPDHLCLDYGQVIAPLVSVVQAQQRRIDDLEQRLTALEQRLG